jgi:hypothetical protein
MLLDSALPAEATGITRAMLSPRVSLRAALGMPSAGSGLILPCTHAERAEVSAANRRLAAVTNKGNRH